MLVDDSMVARAVLSRMIESDDELEICGVAGTAEDAIEALQAVRVDVIVLDLEMPGAGGLKSIPRIIAASRGEGNGTTTTSKGCIRGPCKRGRRPRAPIR